MVKHLSRIALIASLAAIGATSTVWAKDKHDKHDKNDKHDKHDGNDKGEASAGTHDQINAPIEWKVLPPELKVEGNYALQKTVSDGLTLTASNGFFSDALNASGSHPWIDESGHEFIRADFAVIEGWGKEGEEARWHFYAPQAGEVKIAFGGAVSSKGEFVVSLDGEEHHLVGGSAQPVSFNLKKAGLFQLTVRCAGADATARLGDLVLRGAAMAQAALLRARWRPGAAHSHFSSSQCEDTQLWVMSTRVAPGSSSYSPITTPFGYYGSTFDSDGICGGSCNFSFWSFGKDDALKPDDARKPKDARKPQDQWSYLLASGSPDADFGSFHHEGCGVKLRGEWKPLAGCKEVTLALRRQFDPPFATYFSYFLDGHGHWKLYGVGRKFVGDKTKGDLFPGNFVEEPGPPARERSGDLIRSVMRRGWCMNNEQWRPLDMLHPQSYKDYANMHFSVDSKGWFTMGMGGMAHEAPGKNEPVKYDGSTVSLPDFLSSDRTRELYVLPAQWGPRQFLNILPTSATLDATLKDAGKNAKATLYYGTSDCFTFIEDLGYPVKTRIWEHHLPIQAVSAGVCHFELKDLKPGTRYFTRILIENDAGKIWTFEADQFTTPAAP